MCTPSQRWLIEKLGRELGLDVDGDADNINHVLTVATNRSHWASLRVYEASAAIGRLKQWVEQGEISYSTPVSS